MERVLGIGGLFVRAADPATLSKWHQEHLGVSPVPKSYEAEPWSKEAGATVIAPFPADTTYFGKAEQAWMVINFWVRDLARMLHESARFSRRAGASQCVMGPKSMAIAMVEDASRAVACMNQREIAQAQAVPAVR